MTRVMATLEVEDGYVVLRDENGGELAVVRGRFHVDPVAVATDLISDLVHDMRSREAEVSGE